MLAKQPASLGGFEFDAIIKRSETMTSDVPEYATEEGYSITDNICLKPRELEIEAIITNSPVTWAEQHAASSSRVETMIEELRQLWLKKTPVQFTAAGDSYENMCITSITAPRTVEDGSSTRLTIKLKQASINSTDMANISVKEHLRKTRALDRKAHRLHLVHRKTKKPQNLAFCVLVQKPLAFSSEVCKWNTTRFLFQTAMIR